MVLGDGTTSELNPNSTEATTVASLTITEALAEIKTITKRIDTKVKFIKEHLYRQDAFKDPLAKDGGAPKVIEQEIQAIGDLYTRIITIRLAIAEANVKGEVEVDGTKHSVAEWLVWRRDVAPGLVKTYQDWNANIQSARRNAMTKGISVIQPGNEATSINDLIVNLNEKNLSDSIDKVQTILGTLDGRLSLFNATTQVEIPD